MYIRCSSGCGINNDRNGRVIECYCIKDSLPYAIWSLNT
uniref:Uncharacterized protein n=1 Tax=Rhizophora mucronata TaxID=61149 RepID=A0A2P2QAQ8_RHIMU